MSDTYSGAGPTSSAATGQPAQGQPGLADRWSSWIDKPGNRAAMMQFGIAMLQPMQQGEGLLGHTANAIGYGGEAENRVEQEQELKRQRESQEDLRGSQADLATARAAAAGSAADTRTANSQLALERLENARSATGLNALVRLQPSYLKEKEDWELTHDATKEPFMGFQDWMQNRGIDPRTGGGTPQSAENPQQQPAPQGKPLAKDILANPNYRARFDLMRKNPNKAQVKAQLDSIAPHVQDPQTLYSEFGVK